MIFAISIQTDKIAPGRVGSDQAEATRLAIRLIPLIRFRARPNALPISSLCTISVKTGPPASKQNTATRRQTTASFHSFAASRSRLFSDEVHRVMYLSSRQARLAQGFHPPNGQGGRAWRDVGSPSKKPSLAGLPAPRRRETRLDLSALEGIPYDPALSLSPVEASQLRHKDSQRYITSPLNSKPEAASVSPRLFTD